MLSNAEGIVIVPGNGNRPALLVVAVATLTHWGARSGLMQSASVKVLPTGAFSSWMVALAMGAP